MAIPLDNPVVIVIEHAQVTTTTESLKAVFKSSYSGQIDGVTMLADANQVNANDVSNYTKYDAIKTATVAYTGNTGVANSNNYIAAGAGTALSRVSLAAAQFGSGVVLSSKVGKVGTGQTAVACRMAISFVQSAQGME